jgi:CheY-like chemotaxis protein
MEDSAVAVVLVVDDELGIATLLEDVLQDEGHRVLMASNGRQALERMAAERPDLVFTDFMMPVMDGAAMLAAIAADPEFKDIPVIVMSSLPEAAVAERCNGYALFLHKPFNIFDVVDIVERFEAGEG